MTWDKCRTATDGRGAAISCDAPNGNGGTLAVKHDADVNAVRRALHRQICEKRVAALAICMTVAMAR